MNYIMPVTQKGQVTIPKEVRDILGLDENSKLEFKKSKKGNIEIQKAKTILDFAPIAEAPKGMTALKAREYMETRYKRA